MKIIQIIPLSILKKQYKNDWIYELSFWQGVALSLLSIKKYGIVVLYTDSEGFEVLNKQFHLPYDEVVIMDIDTSNYSFYVLNILANNPEGLWLSTNIYMLNSPTFIEKNVSYLWAGDPTEMLSTSRIYEKNDKLIHYFQKTHNWSGYFIFEGFSFHTQDFWKGYQIFLKDCLKDINDITQKYYVSSGTTDKFILKYLLGVYAREQGIEIADSFNEITQQNLSTESIIQHFDNLPFIYASDELKKSIHFCDLVSYLLFKNSQSIFYKIQQKFIPNLDSQHTLFIRTQQCSILMNDPQKRNPLTIDIFKYEIKRKNFIINQFDKPFTDHQPFESLQFLLNASLSDIFESIWYLRDNHIVIESKWKWDMNTTTNLNDETYSKLKVYYNKCEPTGFHNTLIHFHQLNKRVSEVYLDILQVLILHYLKKPKKIKTMIKWIERAVFEHEPIPLEFTEKCILAMKQLALMSCIKTSAI